MAAETKTRVLVLEDDEQLRDVLDLLLQSEGYQVQTAASAREALALAEQASFDLVVADVRMEEMDGLECLHHLKKKQPSLRSIVITAYAESDAPLRAMLVEADDYLRKPFSKVELQQAVRRVLRSRQEREGYRGLLKTFTRWLSGLGSPSSQDEEARLTHLREAFFRSLYVAIRSGALAAPEALMLWRQLEAVDMQRETGQRPPAELSRDYLLLAEMLKLLMRNWDEDVKPDQFATLFARVQDGRLSSEQLMLGPLMRHMDPKHRKSSPEISELYEQLWGSVVPA